MDATLLFPSLYVRAADLMGKDATKTIARVKIDELQMTGGRKEKKPVIYFSDSKKMLVLNKTNCRTIIELYGKETNDWVGKKITLFPTKDRFGPKQVDCIRIRDHVNGKAAPVQPPDPPGMDPKTGEVAPALEEVLNGVAMAESLAELDTIKVYADRLTGEDLASATAALAERRSQIETTKREPGESL